MRQTEFDFTRRSRTEAAIARRVDLSPVARSILMVALTETDERRIDGEPVSLCRLSERRLADLIGASKSGVHEAMLRLELSGLITRGTARFLVDWRTLDGGRPPTDRVPTMTDQSPTGDRPRPTTCRPATDQDRPLADRRPTTPAGGNGEPGGVPSRATIFSNSLSLDVVDVSERDMEDITQRAHEALQRIGQVLKIKPNGQEWDDLCVAAVLSVTKLSREWLAVAVNQTAAAVRSRRHTERQITDPVRYLKGCLRNALAETLGLCSKDGVFAAYGQLYLWARPLVGRLKRHAEAERRRLQCPK